MFLRLETILKKKLVGKRMTMSLADNRTGELWKGFMSRRKEIKNCVGKDFISMQIYDPFYFEKFNPQTEFEKWAAVEVTEFTGVPEGMEEVVLEEGLYAVFLHQGTASDGPKTFQYIFWKWLPESEYRVDQRPHFEVLGTKYKNEDPDSEEEIWIPVRRR